MLRTVIRLATKSRCSYGRSKQTANLGRRDFVLRHINMDKIAGVYQIENIIDGKLYIGSSVDIKTRFRSHKSYLRRGIHTNIHLQRAYNKYRKKNFIYSIILLCDPENTLLYEQMLLDAGIGDYNIAEDASAPNKGKYGELNTFYGKMHTNETKKLISKHHADVSGKNHPLYGKHHSKKSRELISKNHADVKGKNNPNYGKRGKESSSYGRVQTEEAKKKVSEAKKRYWQNRVDRTITDEHKKKVSEGLVKYYETHDSYKRTKENRKKISDSLKKYYANKNK